MSNASARNPSPASHPAGRSTPERSRGRPVPRAASRAPRTPPHASRSFFERTLAASRCPAAAAPEPKRMPACCSARLRRSLPSAGPAPKAQERAYSPRPRPPHVQLILRLVLARQQRLVEDGAARLDVLLGVGGFGCLGELPAGLLVEPDRRGLPLLRVDRWLKQVAPRVRGAARAAVRG